MSNATSPSVGNLSNSRSRVNSPPCIAADSAEFRTLEALVERRLSSVARRYCLQYADIGDLRQEAMLQGLQLIPCYDSEEGSLEAFLSRRIKFAMLDELDNIHSGGITGDYSGDLIEDLSAVVGEDDIPATDEPGSQPAPVVTLLETIPDPNSTDYVEDKFTDDTLQALDALESEEKALLARHFGLAGCQPQTQEALAREFRVSQQAIAKRIALIIEKAKLLVVSTTSTTAGC